MSIFDAVNERFFNPFCCKNRAVYFECITQLIEKSKEIPVLYETDARNTLILYFQNCQYSLEAENIGEEIGNARTPQENASIVLRYFRSCGWITEKEVGRNGDDIASVTIQCRKLIDAIHKIFDGDANGAITNHIFSMYEILKSSFEKDSARAIRPYLNILIPLIENECDLKNELLVLKDSIRKIMQAVMKMADVNSFGQFLIKDELLNRFFNDYFFVKNSGLIPSYISGIDRMMQKLRRSELYERMIHEYVEIENTSKKQAKDKINRLFDELDSFINLEYEEEMDYIDRKINTYYNLYSTRMMMVLGNNTNLAHELNRLLLFLKGLDDEQRNQFFDHLSETQRIYSIRYIGRKSFERRRKSNGGQKSAALVIPELTEEEKQRMENEFRMEAQDRYSMSRVETHLDQIMASKEEISLEECGVHTRDDATMIAASVIYSGAAGFPYEVEFKEGTIETEAARMSNIKIRRKR